MATTYYVRPADGKRRRVSDGWRIWGILFGPIAILFAGLWLHALLALCGAMAIGFVTDWITGLQPGDPDYIWTNIPSMIFGAIYGGFIPRLLRRKYERMGWRRTKGAYEN
ncbi:MAG: hypothetical protein HZY74_07785 [Brevundimonas sp.]|nr:MAG: hypothetical protein HZY74_07785 [Brevundimonas sp.]